MSIFSSIGSSFSKVFTNPKKANIGQIATVTGILGGTALGVASYGASQRPAAGNLGEVGGRTGTVVGGKVVWDQPANTFSGNLALGAKSLAGNAGDILGKTATAVYKGAVAGGSGLYSGSTSVLKSIVTAPNALATFLGSTVPALLAQKNLGASASDITSGASKFFDALNGGLPGSAPAETSVAALPSAASTDAAANIQEAGMSLPMMLILGGIAVTLLFGLFGKKR